ncbi:hypothetical protein KP509_16G072000 [Ceratopteris richardii]|uniref:Uncharacterized protein n=1 Tax=Ceratopteris richardii TaxID=49495 RepID=A0A8T2T0M5_CERRI|nr:hypothetical protein KP509_16G072000 [Ceratopteris richardii]
MADDTLDRSLICFSHSEKEDMSMQLMILLSSKNEEYVLHQGALISVNLAFSLQDLGRKSRAKCAQAMKNNSLDAMKHQAPAQYQERKTTHS